MYAAAHRAPSAAAGSASVRPAAAAGVDAMVSFLISQSISRNTQRTYEAPQRAYREYCAEQHLDELDQSSVLRFLAAAASRDGKPLAGRPIGVYRSAISTMHELGPNAHLPNPARGEQVNRMCDGVLRVKAEADKERRDAHTPAYPITPELLTRIEPIATLSGDQSRRIMWAAACLGTFFVLRPGELFGSRDTELGRVLRADQISFERGGQPASIAPGTSAALPDVIVLALGPTKTDQLGMNAPRRSSAGPVLRAVWAWAREREMTKLDPHWVARIAASGHTRDWNPFLFSLPIEPNNKILEDYRVFAYLNDWLPMLGIPKQHIAGKSFRRGGASGMMAAGVDREDAAAIGGWASTRMLDTYTSAAADAQRRLAITKKMGEAAGTHTTA